MTSRIYGSSGNRTNPLTVVGLLVGLVGAGCSAILWLHRISPSSAFLKSITAKVSSTGTFGDRLELIALVAGAIAIFTALISAIGGRRGGTGVVVAVVLGLGALSYPVLVSLNIIGKTLPSPLK